jgi:hypothetical protein
MTARRTEPSKSLLQGAPYVPAHMHTDPHYLSKKWAVLKVKPAANVSPIKRRAVKP